MYKVFFKRFLDFSISFLALVLLSPIFIIVLVLLIIYNNGKPFFFQKRPGKNEVFFYIIKFKTMNDKKDKDGNLLPDEERLTNVGLFVRKSSLDEIPQLINVLKGDMSLIGPRPLLPQYLELYDEEQKKRHNVKPGITGWAQINGRNDITWKKKFQLDVWYVNNISFMLDLTIFFKTFTKVFKSEGINKTGSLTTEYFNGNN
ncbi:lipid carrier--UDP-N-acetylgalactosaminyltransferase [Tenacibaculum sp. SZ-18]|uniref:sugar transferase n=1 Tax=Tenacibaculum sp. SZ-18 TaxID=754423 RepID=UPI000C2D321E|nr:sugar transferase [Tenacibaculum sp. SZ-18]AUC14172.1 lipid carrier--UDP-N-acetylgalactosaminyltransferase [Tenacibaculum sp. SZ-18]